MNSAFAALKKELAPNNPPQQGDPMDIVKLLTDLAATVAALQTQLVDAQAAADSISKDAYDKGFADGVSSVGTGDKIFSQAEVDAMLAPLQTQVTDLQAQVTALQGS